MKQIYITSIPLQKTIKSVYQTDGFTLEKNPETGYPIIPVLASTMESISHTQVIALRSMGPQAQDNYNAFLEELAVYGISSAQVTTIPIGNYSNQSEMIRMLMSLLDAIPSNSLVYADITYQTKPVSATILHAMCMIEGYRNDTVQVKGVYYGEYHRDVDATAKVEDVASLYDLTAMKRMLDVMGQLRALGVQDTSRVLRGMMNDEGND